MSIKGVIVDLDGTILDSTWVWTKIDHDFLGQRGIDVPPDYSQAIISMGFEDVAKYTIKRFRLQETVEEVMAQWNAMACEAYASEVNLKQGTKELLFWLRERGIKVGIATSNSASLFVPCLLHHGIYECFHSYTETGDVKRGKEYPDVYIKEAEKIGCRPEECVVLEDIIPALRGAKSGGFITVGVREEKWKYEEKEFTASCDFVVNELMETVAILEQISAADRVS